MRQGIHPDYDVVVVSCGCGNTFSSRSTAQKVSVEVCSVCHPFYTGKQKLLDAAGMIEKFQKKWDSDAAKRKAADHTDKKKASPQDRAVERAARVMRGEVKLSQIDSLIKKEPKPPEPPLPRVDQAPVPEATTPPPATPS